MKKFSCESDRHLRMNHPQLRSSICAWPGDLALGRKADLAVGTERLVFATGHHTLAPDHHHKCRLQRLYKRMLFRLFAVLSHTSTHRFPALPIFPHVCSPSLKTEASISNVLFTMVSITPSYGFLPWQVTHGIAFFSKILNRFIYQRQAIYAVSS